MTDAAGAIPAMRHRWWVLLALVGLCLLPFVHGTVLVSAPYGDSHDGRNGATWAAAAESLRADPIESRLGAVRLDGSTYANHPPGIVLALGTVESVAGDRPAVDRAAMLLATWSALVLLFILLRRLRFTIPVALVGCAAVAATPMVRVYGSMVDTPVLGLPIAVAALLAVVEVHGTGRVRWWHHLVFGLGPLVSWQAALLEVLALVALAMTRRRRPALVLAAPLASGLALLGLWLLWAHGSFGPVVDQLLFRSGAGDRSDVGLTDALDTQWFGLRAFLGPLLWSLPIAAAACASRLRSRRMTAGLSLATVIAFDVLMANGAAIHDYWSYWVLIPVAIGSALGVEGLARVLRRTSFSGAVQRSVMGLAVVVVVTSALVRTTTHERVNVSSAAIAPLVRDLELPEGQDVLWVLAETATDDRWWMDLDPPPARHLDEASYRREVRAGHGRHLVLVSTSCTLPFLACDRIPGPPSEYADRDFVIMELRDLDRRHPRV